MERSTLWWHCLNKDERALVVFYERGRDDNLRSNFIPDDCRECTACSTPHNSFGLCPICSQDYRRLLAKADETFWEYVNHTLSWKQDHAKEWEREHSD